MEAGNQRRRGLRKWGARSCDFPTEEITSAQNFNFATNFPQNGELKATNFVFLKKIFGQAKI